MSFRSGRSRTLNTGTVVNVHATTVDVRLGGSPQLLRQIPVVGGTDDVTAGDTVLLQEYDGLLYAQSLAARSGSRRVVQGGGSSGGGSMSPHAMDYHTDENSWHANLTGTNLHPPKEHTHDFADVAGSLNADMLHIDWVPTNSTPDSTIAEAADDQDLSAILKGLDDAITTGVSDMEAAPIVTTEATDALSDERVMTATKTVDVTVSSGKVELDVLLRGVWSGLKDGDGLFIDRGEDFNWSGQHQFAGAVKFTGKDDSIWFDPIRSALYVNSGAFPTVRPAIDAALTVHPAYKSQSGLVVQRPWSLDEYTGKIFRIIDEQRHDLIVLTGDGDLESGNPAFVSGATGWQIAHDGSAEFNDIVVRGELRASVFVYEEQHAQGGTLMVLEAAPLAKQVTT